MNRYIIEEMNRIVDQYIHTEDLNNLIKRFIQDKAAENSIWSRITEYSHKMLGGNFPRIGRAAALTELIILALDIADDLQDRDNTGKPWMTCAPEFALNALLAFQAVFMAELGELQPYAAASLAKETGLMLTGAINGQQKDLNDTIVTEDDYIAMIRQKSGSLMKLACLMGYSFLETYNHDTAARMNELAECVGIMAQIRNDMRDVMRVDLKNDLLQKKRTLPVLYLLEHGDQDFPVLKQFYEGGLTDEQFLKHKLACLRFIEQSGCVEYCTVIQSLYFNRAEELFGQLPAVAPWSQLFKELTFAKYEITASR